MPQIEDVTASLCQIITDEVKFPKPRLRVKRKVATEEKPLVESVE